MLRKVALFTVDGTVLLSAGGGSVRRKQGGVILLIVLVFLAVMLIGALTMIRSTDSATLVAANLGYKQNGISSGDMAIEAAIAWLAAQSSSTLQDDSNANGYLASYSQNGPDIKNGQTWAEYWDDTSVLPSGYKCWISWSGSPAVATCHTSSSGLGLFDVCPARNEAG